MVLAGLRGKLERYVRTTDEYLRERLIIQHLHQELDVAEGEAGFQVELAMLPLIKRESVVELARKQYAKAQTWRRIKEMDPFATKDSPTQAAVRHNMGVVLGMLEQAGLMEYEEPSLSVQGGDA